MAGDTNQPAPNIGGNGFIWILLVAAGTYFVAHQIPLEGSRPASTERSIREQVGEQHVDARLWQDPFAAVADSLAKSPDLRPENCDGNGSRYKDIEMYCRPPLGAPGAAPDLTLLVSVSGTPYSEDQEARRRRRYAVLAGLDAEGFVPEDPQHIGFYWPDAAPSPPASAIVQLVSPPRDSLAVQLPGSPPPLPTVTLPKVVPFEWFKLRPERVEPERSGYRRILLLWFDEDALAASPLRPSPLKQFAKLLCPYLHHSAGGAPPDRAKVKILGPQLSTTLKAVVDEVDRDDWSKDDWSSGSCPGSASPQFYVSDATVSDATLIPKRFIDSSCLASNACLSEFFDNQKNIKLYRLIATDDELARTIRDELRLRGIARPGVIAEWYARYEALVRSVGDKLGLRPRDLRPRDLRPRDKQNRDGDSALLSKWYAGYEALVRFAGDKLGLRPIEPQNRHSHIALVSEWDTLYGRALPDSMARCLDGSECQRDSSNPFLGKDWLHPFKYLRGLDGQMPNIDGLGSGNGSKDNGNKDKDSKDSGKGRPDPRTKDRAEGQGQFDYLRRLGDHIQQLDADLRRDSQRGIEAVGVLGSDVYDKLLVLQALRPLLPDAWFFTTDLDALLLHPTAQTLTRNLLVASGFGLQLRPDIQGEIPPFRSSYQTAEFLAARVAIHSDRPPKPTWLRHPLLFEIGSSREFQFASEVSDQSRLPETNGRESPATEAQGRPETEAQRRDHPDCTNDLHGCTEIQPLASAMTPRASISLVIVFAGLGLCLALLPRALRKRVWNGVDTFMRRSKSNAMLTGRLAAAILGFCLVILALALILYALWPPLARLLTDSGQPMALLEGISVWPTVFLRLATLALCIWLIFRGWQRLDENMERIARDMHLVETRKRVRAEQADIVRSNPPWTGFVSHFWYRLPGGDHATHGENERSPRDVSRFWRMYVYQGRLSARIWRVAAGIMAMLLLWVILFLVFGHPHVPTRGNISLYAYKAATFFLVFATLFLVFFVADTTLLSWRIIKAFRTETAIWPPETVHKYGERLGFEHRCLDDWLGLVFISKRTKCITTLLYYPFLIIALIVVSRSRLFANYGPSIPDLVTMGLGVLIVTACAVALRWSAEASRAKARRRLNDQIAAARSLQDGGRLAGQLEMLLRRVAELREGAFSPFSQQPLVRAMLLPLGSLGGTALLEYVLAPGFG